jgi:riboflavin synthase alpha subunit
VFTGLIGEVGRLEAISQVGGISRLDVRAPLCSGGLRRGDSLAVNGICLTVIAVEPPHVRVEATAETRRVTTLARWRRHDPLHLEPALRVGDTLGGHIVYGHIDGTGRIVRLSRRGLAVWMTVRVPPALSCQLVAKGAIAVDGVSLTLDEGPFPGRFTVTLIPHTLTQTRFGRAKPGDRVNIELDVLAKRAARPLEAAAIAARGWDRRGPDAKERV